MRKIFMILTLIVSSFFIFNTSVKADTIETEVKAEYYALINDNFFTLREKVIDLANEKQQYYIIHGDKYGNLQFSLFDNPNLVIGSNNIIISGNYTAYGYNSGSITQGGTFSTLELTFWNTAILRYFVYYDTNAESIEYTGTDTFLVKYNDLSYLVEPGGSFPTLYQIYLDNNKSPEEPPVEDDEIIIDESLNSFYSLVMEKIQLFANYFISNNILLFVIGIFILIFIIELIRRYLL